MNTYQRTRKLEFAALLVGLGLFVGFILRTGPSILFDSLRRFGIGFLFVILISGSRHLLRTAAWYYCIDLAHRRLTFFELLQLRLVGDAATDLTFIGPLAGETLKTLAVSRRIPALDSVSSVVIENSLYGLSVVLLIVGGLLVFVFSFAFHQPISTLSFVFGLASLGVVLAAYWIVAERHSLLARVTEQARELKSKWPLFERQKANVQLVVEKVRNFCRLRRQLLLAILSLEVLVVMAGVTEAYFILSFSAHQSSFFAAYLTESVNRIVNAVFAFVPLRIGVEEGGAGMALAAVGYSVSTGVTLGIIRKARTLFWVGCGLLIAGRYGFVQVRAGEASTRVGVAWQ